MNRVALIIFAWVALFFSVDAQESDQKRIKIGVPTALSGSAVALGSDIKNTFLLMNEKYGTGRYDVSLCRRFSVLRGKKRLLRRGA